MITDFIHSEAGSIIISILWGLGLAMMFRRICTSRECITVFGPAPADVRNKKIKWQNKCYVVEPKDASCDDIGTEIINVRY